MQYSSGAHQRSDIMNEASALRFRSMPSTFKQNKHANVDRLFGEVRMRRCLILSGHPESCKAFAWEVGLAMVNTHEGRVRSPLRPLFPHSLRPAVVSVAARGLYIAALFFRARGWRIVPRLIVVPVFGDAFSPGTPPAGGGRVIPLRGVILALQLKAFHAVVER